MGNRQTKWWDESDAEAVSMPKYSSLENRAFYRGRRYERRRLLRIALWSVAGLIITVVMIRFLDGYVIFVPVR
jgi:hypothetical protein